MTVHFSECSSCRSVYFPERLVCRRCGGDDFQTLPVRAGVVQGVTELEAGVVIVDVLAAGIRVVASCSGSPRTGEELELYSGAFDRRRTRKLFIPHAVSHRLEGEA